MFLLNKIKNKNSSRNCINLVENENKKQIFNSENVINFGERKSEKVVRFSTYTMKEKIYSNKSKKLSNLNIKET
jgi:hypothetical protein